MKIINVWKDCKMFYILPSIIYRSSIKEIDEKTSICLGLFFWCIVIKK